MDLPGPRLPLLLLLLASTGYAGETGLVRATPGDYREKLGALEPGDVLELAPGEYDRGLTLRGLHGRPDAWIVIRGPGSGAPARFLGDPEARRNTVEIRTASYVALENLHLDGRDVAGVFAIHASGSPVHHIRVEGCRIEGHGASQGTVAISTKTPTWDWVIRRNTIVEPGTGFYLGNSDGTDPFIGGVIEHNLVVDPVGYGMQVKHQVARPELTGMPTGVRHTILRHNVIVKRKRHPGARGRPVVLIGEFPAEGPGADDLYEIYGNVFAHNPDEVLVQASGRVAIHHNLFLDSGRNSALLLRDHNGQLATAYVYCNTFLGGRRAIRFQDAPRKEAVVFGNLMLTDLGLSGRVRGRGDDIWMRPRLARDLVVDATPELGQADPRPLEGAREEPPLDFAAVAHLTDHDRDFEGRTPGDGNVRGAYARLAAEGEPWWLPAVALKPALPAPAAER